MSKSRAKAVLYQDVSKKIRSLQRALDRYNEGVPAGARYSESQITYAGEVIAVLVWRRVLSRLDANALSPRGLAAVADLIRPETTCIEEVVADGVLASATSMLRRPPQTAAALVG